MKDITLLRKGFSNFTLQLFYLGYNFLVYDNRGTDTWTLVCENNSKVRITVYYNIRTGRIEATQKRLGRFYFNSLEEVYKILLYNAEVEEPEYIETTKILVTLINLTDGLLPFLFKTRNLHSDAGYFDLPYYGRVKNIRLSSRDGNNVIEIDNRKESLITFKSKVFSVNPISPQ